MAWTGEPSIRPNRLAGQDAGLEAVGDALVPAEQVTGLARPYTYVTGWDVGEVSGFVDGVRA